MYSSPMPATAGATDEETNQSSSEMVDCTDDDIGDAPVNVLLIDDQAMIGEAVRRMLASEPQVKFHYCSDPRLAITQAEAIAPTVILQDLVMPDVDGLSLLQQFRSHPQLQSVPLIMLSTRDEPAVKAQAFGLGANDYLIKLPDRVELVARIRYHSRAYQNLQARSAAITAQNHAQELEQTLVELRETQAQLIQTEKLSNLGQMVAGVAHEMSNPVNFVSGNLKYVQDYVQDLIGFIQLYQREYPQTTPAIDAQLESLDFNFMVEDLSDILASMKLGTDRLRDVALSLRNFARSDQDKMQEVDLHEGIDGTLLILNHRLNRRIDIIKQYGELPLVACYPAQLNQVFMNIINNAIDAQLEYDHPAPRQITIGTQALDSHWVEVKIADNGPGMPSEVKQKLFDPFFTTKSIGKGTGLGLSIVRQIVEKHRGLITVESEPERGTTFLIRLAIG
jgi:two-component system, NtrC family, sensor kinase